MKHDAKECPATGKRRFSSQGLAKRSLNCFKRSRSRRGTIPKRVYFCRECRGWHLTSLKAPEIPMATKTHRCRICRGDRPNDGVICLGCGTALIKCQETRKKRLVTECPGCRASGPFKAIEAGRMRCTKCTAVFESGDFDFVDDRPDINVEKKERLEMERRRSRR